MRNFLVFPDGTRIDFMYPSNRDIGVGTRFNLTNEEDQIKVIEVKNIEKTEKEVLFYVDYI